MKDLFCTFEQSKKLKELGFKERCFGAYKILEDEYIFSSKEGDLILGLDADKKYAFVIKAPLKTQVFKWFRNKYNIDAWVQPFMEEKNNKLILPDESYSYFIFKDGILIKDGVDFIDFEEAENECINQLIKLIDEKI